MWDQQLHRLSTWATLICGSFIIFKKVVIETLIPVNPITNTIGTLGLVTGLFALTGLYLFQKETIGKLGLLGYLANWFGLAFVSGVDYVKLYVFPYMSESQIQALLLTPARGVFIVCAMTFLLGVILFSVALLRANTLPRLATIFYLIGFTVYALSFIIPPIIVVIGQIVGAIGILWWGYTMWISNLDARSVRQSLTVNMP